MKDSTLIVSFLGGTPTAIKIITDWIRAVVFHSNWHDYENAEDVVSDTVYKILNLLRADKFRGESSLKVYVSRIARYTVIDAIRRERRAREIVVENVEQPREIDSPETEYLEAEKWSIFQRIFDLIDEKCRHLWKLIFVERLSYAAIAIREKSSENAVKVRAFRCREKAISIRDKIHEKPSSG